jgi:hypothetical protein
MRYVVHEWDVEVGSEDEEIADHIFCSSLEEAVATAKEQGGRIVLVRSTYECDDLDDRLWAYMTPEGVLPEFFSDSLGRDTGVSVPKRFR